MSTEAAARLAAASRPLGLILIIGALSAFGPLSIDMYLPGLPALTGDLGGAAWQVQLTLSACLLGLAGGQVVAGPLSDSLGRRARCWSACWPTPWPRPYAPWPPACRP